MLQGVSYLRVALFEPTHPASEQPQTYALDRAVTGTGFWTVLEMFKHDSYAYK